MKEGNASPRSYAHQRESAETECQKCLPVAPSPRAKDVQTAPAPSVSKPSQRRHVGLRGTKEGNVGLDLILMINQIGR